MLCFPLKTQMLSPVIVSVGCIRFAQIKTVMVSTIYQYRETSNIQYYYIKQALICHNAVINILQPIESLSSSPSWELRIAANFTTYTPVLQEVVGKDSQ